MRTDSCGRCFSIYTYQRMKTLTHIISFATSRPPRLALAIPTHGPTKMGVRGDGFLFFTSDKHKCVTSTSGKALLTLSRVTAGGLFPSIAICMLSKCYASRYFLNRSWLALVVSFEPAHELHTYFGSLTFLLGVIHGCAHIARAFSDGDGGGVLVEGQLNRSGLVVFFLLVLIVVPMTTACLKKSVSVVLGWKKEGSSFGFFVNGYVLYCSTGVNGYHTI